MKIIGACTGGGVGDLIAAMPAIQALHRHFCTRIDMLTTSYAAPILHGQPAVGAVLHDDGDRPLAEIAMEIGRRGYTHAVVFWSNPRIAALLWHARIPTRVGQSRRLYSFRYTKRVPVRTERGDITSHWSDVQMDYARALGATPQAQDYVVSLPLYDADKAQAQSVIDRLSIPDPFIVLHAVRGISSQRAAWPAATFARLADGLSNALSAAVVLSGSQRERSIAGEIAGRMQTPGINAAGLSTLRGLAALMQRAAVVVALDSGPMHIAAAVGAPTVGIFALRTDMPKRWRPLGPHVEVIEPRFPCPPRCRKETCRTFACYAALPVELVVAAAQSLLSPSTRQIAL
ncbi:MAG: glycosyltransferase family 9 protein [Candidatus Eremiobacteraeota bacterium]|nr:glycosyltransferase family 9 protein [Candidatus Eremiobacteraeota bacterium]